MKGVSTKEEGKGGSATDVVCETFLIEVVLPLWHGARPGDTVEQTGLRITLREATRDEAVELALDQTSCNSGRDEEIAWEAVPLFANT
jgi:hypothetical protein